MNEVCYTIYSKITTKENEIKFNLLKKAFKKKEDAYKYANKKIEEMLEYIYDIEFKNSLPIKSVLIYTLFFNKKGKESEEDRYIYILNEYKQFFKDILYPSTMYYISEHQIIN